MGGEMIEVWRGSVRQWEVDEMGHWNTQYYVARAHEGLAMLFGFNGLPDLMSPRSSTTLAFNEHHIRFHREAHGGAPLHMQAGFIDATPTTAFVLLVMHHSDSGQIAATFRVRVTHVDAADGTTPRSWPADFLKRIGASLVGIPKEAAPRSTNDEPVIMAASRGRAIALGLKRTSMSLIERDSCDAFDRMRPQKFIGAVGSGVKQLTGPLRAHVAELAQTPPGRIGGAVLEFRILYGQPPCAGDCFEIWAGLQTTYRRTMSLIFWIVDPFTDRVYGSMQSTAIIFDLDARAVVEISPAATKVLARYETEGLTL